jgi:hypothetical protein
MLEKTKKISRANSSFRAFALSAFCLLLSAFLPLASFAQTIPNEIFAEYVGDATITDNLLGVNQVVPEITVSVENRNSEDDYFIKVMDLDLMGIGVPIEFDKVIIASYSGGYKLLRTEPIAFVLENVPIPEITIPGLPFTIPAGNYNFPIEISLGNTEIVEYALNMNVAVKVSIIYYISVPITTFNIAFTGLREVPPPPPTPPTITTTNIPSGIEKQAYTALFEATGDAPITWSIISGALPTGITLDPTTGAISGIPTEPNTFTFTVQAENLGGTDSKPFTIIIEAEEDTVGINTPAFEAFKIFPNPTTSELRVEISDMRYEISDIEIFDLSGKKLVQVSSLKPQVSNLTSINITHLPAGVYIIKIQTDKGVYKQQFIKK